ncbi:MAG: PhoX family phosphatase [Reyranella sp.]|uniref:PhoX family protein n=1 Tax=Reyranella sp. TaxID=1929291 RepID=UPI000B22A825|nr:PhoX family phosphatase [Reyranella sp.]MBN9537798.1 PhoX family phosphatase [Alphaproteobacteria bacterium]MBR2818084.1 PhoX family phosphatase [Reyranella sp.]
MDLRSLDNVDPEDIGSNTSAEPSVGALIERRFGRRAALRGLVGVGAIAAFGNELMGSSALAQPRGPSSLTFEEVPHGLDQTHHVPTGYDAEVVIRWGDPVVAGAPAFDPANQTAAAQEKQFGYNCDFVDVHPLPAGSTANDRFLLVVNHEYTDPGLMFSGLGAGRDVNLKVNEEQAKVEIAAHGGSVVEIVRAGQSWKVVPDSKFARRITGTTPMRISGPAAGHDKLKTSADAAGRDVLGMFNNCAGGSTPWGTWLTCEENFNFYFGSADAAKLPEAASYKRYGISKAAYGWGRYVDRFNLDKEPNEPFRFGWVVEIDPYDPSSTPIKRTALGRFKHEGCTYALAKDGRVVFYSGDDERFEYLYKFVTTKPWNRQDRAANRDLLDEGTLYVARFGDDGKIEWLPLVQGQGPLTAENGFATQADVVINARLAGDLLKATPMDRPEDVETNPVNGRTYVMLTNNTRRTEQQVNRANPVARNAHGHVIEITPKDGDHAATEGAWTIFIVGGKPGIDPAARYHRQTSDNGWLSCVDNCTFDSKGRIWIATDGAPTAAGIADGLYGADTAGYGRGLTRCFFQAPTGAEVCGPLVSPDDSTVFLAIQHPGEDAGSTYDQPSTRWPDFKDNMPPRPSVIAITKKGGGPIGS